jgi:hypothetical protein
VEVSVGIREGFVTGERVGLNMRERFPRGLCCRLLLGNWRTLVGLRGRKIQIGEIVVRCICGLG